MHARAIMLLAGGMLPAVAAASGKARAGTALTGRAGPPGTGKIRGIPRMNLRQTVMTTAIALIAVTSPIAAHATAIPTAIPTAATFNITLPDFTVTDIIVFNAGSPFSTFEQGAAGAPLTATAPGTTTLTDTYLTAADTGSPGFVYTPGETFLLGVASLSGDPSQQDLVLFTNDAFASSAVGVAFDTLFPDTDEATLISDLVNTDNPGDLFNFGSGDALTGTDGSIFFTPGDSFTAVAFSDGQIIGTGTSSFVTASVPEPAGWAVMLAGLAGLAGLGGVTRARRGKLAS